MCKSWRLGIAAAVSLSLTTALWAQQYPFQIIVRSDHPGKAIRRKQLADVFLGKQARWGDGQPILAVDQSIRSKLREAFTWEIFGQRALAVESYWRQQLVTGGRRPPPVKDSDAKVIAYVASEPGTIGYVAAGTELPDSVRILRIVD